MRTEHIDRASTVRSTAAPGRNTRSARHQRGPAGRRLPTGAGGREHRRRGSRRARCGCFSHLKGRSNITIPNEIHTRLEAPLSQHRAEGRRLCLARRDRHPGVRERARVAEGGVAGDARSSITSPANSRFGAPANGFCDSISAHFRSITTRPPGLLGSRIQYFPECAVVHGRMRAGIVRSSVAAMTARCAELHHGRGPAGGGLCTTSRI